MTGRVVRRPHRPHAGPANTGIETGGVTATSLPARPLPHRLIDALLILGTVFVPLVLSRTGADSFRLPKLALFRAVGILILALAAGAFLWKRRTTPLRLDRAEWIGIAVAVWTAVTTLVSTNPLVSLYSLATVMAALAVFFAARHMAARSGARVLIVLFISAAVNGIVFFLGYFRIWSPYFDFSDQSARASDLFFFASSSTLLGNPNDVGTFFLLPAIVSVALALESRRRAAILFVVVAAISAMIIVAAHTLSAVVALVAGVLTLAARSPRKLIGALLILVFGLALAFVVIAPFHERVDQARRALESGHWNDLLSGRLVSYMAAIEMFRSNPLTGVGPGRFGGEFLDKKIQLLPRYPMLFRDVELVTYSFGETHNDHLQILAETGWPGLVLFLLALVTLSRAGAHNPSTLFSARVAGLLLPALAVSFAVLALAQFPLQLASALSTYLYVAGLCYGWSTAQ